MIRKCLSFFLAAVLVFSLSACQGRTPDSVSGFDPGSSLVSLPESQPDSSQSSSTPSFPEDENADSGEKGTLYYITYRKVSLGLTKKTSYDFLKLLACLQGLMNREKPSLYIDFLWQNNVDSFWFRYLRQEGKLLHGYKKVELTTYREVIQTLGPEIEKYGVVLWDEAVPATANVATTISGVDNCLPLRFDDSNGSLYKILTALLDIPVKMDLTGKFTGTGTIPDTNLKSSGSTKCDAYLWAAELYLDKTHPEKMAYILDAISWAPNTVDYQDLSYNYLANQDYFVANKMFVFDLSPWGDEVPSDDPDQPLGTDLATFKTIMQRQYDRTKGEKIIQVSGFIPMMVKYTEIADRGKHGDVETEWQYAEILSAYNAVMDADAGVLSSLSNASIFRLSPLKNKYENNRPTKTKTYDPTKKYVLLYMGDYDSAAWIARYVPQWWNDPARGKIPLNWAFNPNLSDRIGPVFDYIYENKTANDFFIAGDSGAGYLNPSLLEALDTRSPSRVHSNNPTNLETGISITKNITTSLI